MGEFPVHYEQTCGFRLHIGALLVHYCFFSYIVIVSPIACFLEYCDISYRYLSHLKKLYRDKSTVIYCETPASFVDVLDLTDKLSVLYCN